MKIGIDAQVIGRHRTGDETYIKNLVERFGTLRPNNDFYLYYTQDEALDFFRTLKGNYHPRKLIFSNPFLRVPLAYRWAARNEPVDVFHTAYVGIAPPNTKLALTVHDLAWEYFPETFSRNRALFLKMTRWSVHRADVIMTPSGNTKRDLVKLYGVQPEKIRVIYNGNNPMFKPCEDPVRIQEIKQKFGITKPFVLSVGALQPRKNLKRLMQAFIEARKQKNFDYQLVLVGKKAWGDSGIEEILKLRQDNSDIIQTGYVDDAELPVLYSGADLFAYVSLYEGFGLPPVEAMACGAPLITANNSSFPETSGNAAYFVDPLNVADMTKALLEMTSNKNLRETLRLRGLERSKLFTWDLSARQTLAAYESAFMGSLEPFKGLDNPAEINSERANTLGAVYP